MSRKTKNSNLVINILAVLLALCILVILILSYTEVEGVPVWKEVFSLIGVKTDTPETEDFITFLDVGQGDSILITSNGQRALIDTSTLQNSNAVYNNLKSVKAKGIDLMVLTHCHDDHYGGAEMLSQKFAVKNIIVPDIALTDEDATLIKSAMANVLSVNGNCYTAKAGMNSDVGDFEITVLSAPYDFENENNRSIILIAEIQEIKFLFMADAERGAEQRLLEDNLNLDCDVLKVGHHGGSSSTTEDFLDACSPEYAVISCGVNNQYNHPSDEAVARLEERNIAIYRTDLMGDISFFIENGKMSVKTQK